MNQLKIKLNDDDFLEIKKFFLDNQRPKLSADFADFASLKIQKHGVKCWLKNNHNFISKKNCNYFKVFLSLIFVFI